MICSQCSADGKSRKPGCLPRNWKKLGESVYCAACWGSAFALRAVTVPIVGPVCTEMPGATGSRELLWPEFREKLKASWIATTAASNFIVRELAKSDSGLGPPDESGKQKLMALPRVYCYPQIRERWPILDPSSVNCLEQSAQGRYRKSRWDMATGATSLPSFRYPVPIPAHNGSWKVWEDDGGRLLLSFRLSGDRITVRLRGGSNFRRQLGALRKIIRGEARQGELAIYRVSANIGDNRNGDTKGTRVMAKVVAYLPREERRAGYAVGLHTGGDAFLSMFDENRNKIFRWNRDDLHRRIFAHDEQMQRLREDLKAEKRLRRDREGILARMDLLAKKQNDYLHTVCHQTSASVVEMLRRRRAGTLIYIDADKSYLPHFPWHKLSGMLEDKCHKAGIEFASGPVALEGIADK